MSTQVLGLDEGGSKRVELRRELVHLRRRQTGSELAQRDDLGDAGDEALESQCRGLDAADELALCRLEPLARLEAGAERAECVLVLLAGGTFAQHAELKTKRRVGPSKLRQIGAPGQTRDEALLVSEAAQDHDRIGGLLRDDGAAIGDHA